MSTRKASPRNNEEEPFEAGWTGKVVCDGDDHEKTPFEKGFDGKDLEGSPMKNTDELMQELREDIDRRMQASQEHEQEKSVRAQAVADAEASMAAAIAANDENSHHEAEGALTFAKARLAALEEVSAWWTPEEAAALIQTMFDACRCECRESINEAHALLCAAAEKLQEVNRLAAVGAEYQARIVKHVPLTHSWGFGQENTTLHDIRNVVRALQNKYNLRPE